MRGPSGDRVISLVLCPNELIMAGIDVTFHELSKAGVKKCLGHQESVQTEVVIPSVILSGRWPKRKWLALPHPGQMQ